MSCWVVPSVAAELWGCSVDSIQAAIRNGTLPVRTDNGWTFVDMAPDSPKIHAPKCVLPPTYTTVSKEELTALASESAAPSNDGIMYDEYSEYTEPEPDLALVINANDDAAADPNEETVVAQHLYEQPHREMADDWRQVRARVGATRQAPRNAA